MNDPSRAQVFISHATQDDTFVRQLREALEAQGVPVWVDSRELRGGDKLAPAIEGAIRAARQVLVVLSPHTVNSPWVRREIRLAEEVEQAHRNEGYRVIPLLLPGIEPSALSLWFEEEPVAVPIRLKTGSIDEALAPILAALGERLPEDHRPMREVAPPPLAELILRLSDPSLALVEGKQRLTATAQWVYGPAEPGARTVESRRFHFTAPLGPLEADDLRWYLEEFYRWPTGVFRERAQRIEAALPRWGEALYQAALGRPAAQEVLRAWEAAGEVERRFSVWVDPEPPEGAPEAATLREAANRLLGLPWELLHDGRGYLFQGRRAVRIRRRLPNRHRQPPLPRHPPIRLLLVSPRPEQPGVSYLDHRTSALPLVEAVEALGERVDLTVLTPPPPPGLGAGAHPRRRGKTALPCDPFRRPRRLRPRARPRGALLRGPRGCQQAHRTAHSTGPCR